MKQTFLSFSAAALIPALLFTGCATIVSKTVYPVHIRTQPAGAGIVITDKKNREVFKGKSPATANLKSGAGYFSKAAYTVKISTPGFEEKIIPVNYTINGWYFGNIFLGGVLGMLIIDPVTGAMWKLKDPLIINETLERSKSPVAAGEARLHIAGIDDVPATVRENLVPLNP